MPRLLSSKSRIKPSTSLLSKVRDLPKSAAKEPEWRSWYKTARWQRMRLRVLQRDGYMCQATSVALVGVYPAANSPVVDHIVPHRGNSKLFWDEGTLQAVSKSYHDKDKQILEQSGQI